MRAKFFRDRVVLFEHPQRGIIESEVTPHCRDRVRAMGSHWFAVLDAAAASQSLEAGESVWVTGRQGIVLLVRASNGRTRHLSIHEMENLT